MTTLTAKYAAEAAAEAKAIEANKADGRAARIKAAKEAGGWTAVAKVRREGGRKCLVIAVGLVDEWMNE